MADDEQRGTRLIRVAQVLLLLAAVGLWVASRLTWVVLHTADGLGPRRTVTLTGSTWSTALLPVALLLVAAAVAALAVRGWPLRVLAVLLAAASAAVAYLAISQWVVPDVSVRAADLSDIPVAALVGSERGYVGAAVTLLAAAATLGAGVLLLRAASTGRAGARRYIAPSARRADLSATSHGPVAGASTGPIPPEISERTIWDALDEGRDPTESDGPPDPGQASEGR